MKITKVSNLVEVTWDKTIIVDCVVEANLPDITIIDTAKKIAKLVEISIPLDVNIVTKMAYKISKYWDLEIAYKKCKEFRKVYTIPIIVGVFGTVLCNIENYNKQVSENIRIYMMQKNAVLGTAHILRHVLTNA